MSHAVSPTIALFPGTPRERLARQKARLQELRASAREKFTSGEPGLQVAALISEMIDRFLIELFEETLATHDIDKATLAQQIAIAAVGGSGRGELAPYSDADLLFLYRHNVEKRVLDCVSEMVRDCWDVGIKLGHTVRTVADTLSAAKVDPHLATSLVETRLLWGDERLVSSLKFKFRRQVQWNYSKFYHDGLAGRAEEQTQHGSFERQLEPDVKRSVGSLRDIHLIRWIGFANYGTSDLEMLRLEGAISQPDALALASAQEFLIRVRTDLHFQAGRAQEVLTRDEQVRLAVLYGFEQTPAQRPVERFMQTFFRHSTTIAGIAQRFITRHRPRPLWPRIVQFLLTHRSNGHYLVGPDEIDVPRRVREEVLGSLDWMLNVHELAGLYCVNIAPELVDDMRVAAPKVSRHVSDKSARTFLSILSQTGHVDRLLRSLYATELLDIVVPEFTHTRCLLQFNQYHAYTVDEHSLRAVQAAEALAKDPGPIGSAYRSVRPKNILHLALLLHDLGKGYADEHTIVGLKIATDVAARLKLSHSLTDLLIFLVHKHLMMSMVAFRRDLTDPDVVARFARDVGSPERLTMLYVLTACDMTAVGPTTWTQWKADLVTDLYNRTLLVLSGRPSDFGEAQRLQEICAAVSTFLPAGYTKSPADLEARLKTFPDHYLLVVSAEQIAGDLLDIDRLAEQEVIVRSRYEAERQTTEYRILTRDRVGSGFFSKMSGALTAKRLEILSANVCTTSDGIVADSFQVHDGDHAGAIPEFRVQEIENVLRSVITGTNTVENLFQRNTRFAGRKRVSLPDAEPTRVVIDNESSLRCTVIDVFAIDRPGLLYTIAQALLDLGLSVMMAKIGTHVDQALDVFYVTDSAGGKVEAEDRLTAIHETLLSRLEAFEQQTAAAG